MARESDHNSDEQLCSLVQSVQRCRKKSDTLYGPVHRLGYSGNWTVCGLDASDNGWWVLGYEARYAVTCRSCLKSDNRQ